MTTTNISPPVRNTGDDNVPLTPATVVTSPNIFAARSLAALRIATGFIFLWAFLDKLIGLGYATTSDKSWFSGGSPTMGFLGHVSVGPLESFFHSIAGAGWANVGFMAGLAAIGFAVTAGVALRLSAIGGTILMLLMWAAEWPMARFTSAGKPSGSNNPLVDYHIIYALALIVVAATAAGATWGLGKLWASLPVVQKNSWLL